MSGYLQRLVSVAMGAGSSVHPLLTSVFSRPATPDEPALSPQGDNLKFMSTSRRTDGIPLEISAEFADASTEASTPVHVSRQAEEQPSFDEVQVNKIAQKVPQAATTITVTNSQPLLTSDGPPPTLPAAAQSAEPDSLAVQPSTKRTQRQSRGPGANIPVYVPLLNTMPSVSRSESIETKTPACSDARMSQRRVRQSSVPAAAGGPDEIQIHIGRIEVTAVPPPAATPTPKRATKGLSLQEYLKRRDRSML